MTLRELAQVTNQAHTPFGSAARRPESSGGFKAKRPADYRRIVATRPYDHLS
jgi:hypothetical protein